MIPTRLMIRSAAAVLLGLFAVAAAAQPTVTIRGELNVTSRWSEYPFETSIIPLYTDSNNSRAVVRFKLIFDLSVLPDQIFNPPQVSNGQASSVFPTDAVRLLLGSNDFEVPFDASDLELFSFSGSGVSSFIRVQQDDFFDDDGLLIRLGSGVLQGADFGSLQDARSIIATNSYLQLSSLGTSTDGDIFCYITRVYGIDYDTTGIENVPPIIRDHPNSRTPILVFDAGQDATLRVDLVEDVPGTTVRWFREVGEDVFLVEDGPGVSGATTESLSITVGPATQGLYIAEYRNSNGNTYSAPVRVVNAAPVEPPPIVLDVNGDGSVDFFDILAFLGAFDGG